MTLTTTNYREALVGITKTEDKRLDIDGSGVWLADGTVIDIGLRENRRAFRTPGRPRPAPIGVIEEPAIYAGALDLPPCFRTND